MEDDSKTYSFVMYKSDTGAMFCEVGSKRHHQAINDQTQHYVCTRHNLTFDEMKEIYNHLLGYDAT
jgi:hypothetical protein